MEQFEKWQKEALRFHYSPNTYGGAEMGWKAALEWVLSIDSGFCTCGCPNDSWDNPSVLAQIEKELSNE